LHRLNRNAPITIERRRASRPELDTAIAVFIIEIIEDGCGLVRCRGARGRNAHRGRAFERKPRVTESRAAVLIRKTAGRFVSV